MISALPKSRTKSEGACHHPPNLKSRAACSKIEGLLIRRSKRRQLFQKTESLNQSLPTFSTCDHSFEGVTGQNKKRFGTILQISKATRSKTEVCRHPSRVVSALQKSRTGLKTCESYCSNQNYPLSLTRVDEQYHYRLLGNPYIGRLSSSTVRQT